MKNVGFIKLLVAPRSRLKLSRPKLKIFQLKFGDSFHPYLLTYLPI